MENIYSEVHKRDDLLVMYISYFLLALKTCNTYHITVLSIIRLSTRTTKVINNKYKIRQRSTAAGRVSVNSHGFTLLKCSLLAMMSLLKWTTLRPNLFFQLCPVRIILARITISRRAVDQNIISQHLHYLSGNVFFFVFLCYWRTSQG